MNERIQKMQENIVPPTGQTFVPFIPPEKEGTGLRVLFLGNSFTRHRPKPEIGWHRNCGMAASCLEKDYVHRLMKRVEEVDPNATFAIHTTSFLVEREFETFTPERFRESREWNPDVVILFFGENVPKDYKDRTNLAKTFGDACRELRQTISADGHAKMYWVGCFYIRPELNAEKQAVAREFGDPYISLDDLALREDLHGEFNHPNDLGMELIAQRIWEAIQNDIR